MVGKLALHGGERTVEAGLLQPWPHVTAADQAAVAEVAADPDIRRQRTLQAEKLAEEWNAYCQVKYTLPCNSGTASLHMALAGVGVEAGDEVICPAFTFWATAAAALHHCAIPVFVDIKPGTWTMDPALVEAAITPRTKVLMPVHIHGMPADMDELLAIAERHNLALVEDACQAHGAKHRGRLTGTMGAAAGFSLQQSKNLTTGSEGGLFSTNDEAVYHRANVLQYFGERVVPGREREEQEYNATGLGWMYRGDVFGQAFARSQLRRLDAYKVQRRENVAYLNSRLAGIPGLEVPEEPADRETVWYNYVLGVHPEPLGLDVEPAVFRAKVMEALTAEGCAVTQWQRLPVPGQDIFRHKAGYGKGWPWAPAEAAAGVEYHYAGEDYPVTLDFLARHFYIMGIQPPNGAKLMDQIATAVEKVMGQASSLL